MKLKTGERVEVGDYIQNPHSGITQKVIGLKPGGRVELFEPCSSIFTDKFTWMIKDWNLVT